MLCVVSALCGIGRLKIKLRWCRMVGCSCSMVITWWKLGLVVLVAMLFGGGVFWVLV